MIDWRLLTSAPELVVSANASLVDRGALAVGNVVGSNIFSGLGGSDC